MAALLDSNSLPAAETSLPGYELGAVLGRGGMGEVFRARRVADGREVAVKIAAGSVSGDPALAERLAREADALSRLEHPNILRVLDSGTTEDGRFYLATELADGGDLAQRLREGPLPVDEAARLFREAVLAVAAAHHAGILHRDIKPANVLLTADGHARLADFSLARLPGPDGLPAHSLTGGGDVFGTPYYLAPEARRGVAAADARADIFSLGVLLHELLTGRVPVGNYVPASRVAKVPPAVDRLIARCLAEDPAVRPASAEELWRGFESAWRAPRRGVRAAVLCVLAAVASLAAFQIWQALPGRGETESKSSSDVVRSATRAHPFTNSLGMKFVPVPGTRVLFSLWETRRADFVAFASHAPERVSRADAAWRTAPGQPTPDHPVCFVDFPTALLFCDWLTTQERAAGLVGTNAAYRLPTDEEWSRAAGIRAEPGATPEERDVAMSRERGYFPWGRTWPPPESGIPANFAAEEVNDTGRRSQLRSRDRWPYTAPVGSFPANDAGLFDISGNVAEWCDTPWKAGSDERVLRGGSWNQSVPAALRLTTRQHVLPVGLMPGAGFRVVLDPGAAR
jgi:hypothetical protein